MSRFHVDKNPKLTLPKIDISHQLERERVAFLDIE
jgi:hypothetical protein